MTTKVARADSDPRSSARSSPRRQVWLRGCHIHRARPLRGGRGDVAGITQALPKHAGTPPESCAALICAGWGLARLCHAPGQLPPPGCRATARADLPTNTGGSGQVGQGERRFRSDGRRPALGFLAADTCLRAPKAAAMHHKAPPMPSSPAERRRSHRHGCPNAQISDRAIRQQFRCASVRPLNADTASALPDFRPIMKPVLRRYRRP